MAQDLRDLFKTERSVNVPKMKEGHKDRFLKKLNRELPEKRRSGTWSFMRIAASIVFIMGVGLGIYLLSNPRDGGEAIVDTNSPIENQPQKITLGDLSPDLKKVQDYYVANINLELLDLEVTEDNKLLQAEFMKRLGELDSEYNMLTDELNTIGPNDQTVMALINNLQLRLQLLYQLKEKLNEFKTSKNEQFKNQQI